MRISRSAPRSAVTLLELLVVIGIMLALTALAAGVLPALRQKNNSAKAAAQVQGFLSISKQQAIRDRAPRGIRLIRDPNDNNLVRSLQYVEVPDPTRFEPLQSGTVQPFLTISQQSASDFDNYDVRIQSTASTWDTVGVQLGDYLMISKNNNTNSYFFEVQSFTSSASGTPQVGVLKARSGLLGLFNPPMPPGSPRSGTESDFMIIRRARPLVGEPAIQLPPSMAIDLRYSGIAKLSPHTTLPAPAMHQYAQLSIPLCLNSGYEGNVAQLDILFSSDGELLGTVTDKIILCVKPDDGKAGEATLVAIYARTGAIVLQSVAVSPLPAAATLTVPSQAFDDLFFFTQDGAGSGL